MRTTLLPTVLFLGLSACAGEHAVGKPAVSPVAHSMQLATSDSVTVALDRVELTPAMAAKTTPLPAATTAQITNGTSLASAASTNDSATTRFRGMNEDELVEAMATRRVVRVIGKHHSTAVVFHIELEGGLEIAFKAENQGQEGRWRHEVVAFRLARALGLNGRVPPAVSRTISLSTFGRLAWGEDLVTAHGSDSVAGAAIFWMPVLQDAGLHTDESRATIRHWLDPRRDVPTGADAQRAGQIATVLAFDVLQGNGDRWNVGNIRVDEHGDVVLRDNDSGWFISSLRAPPYLDGVRRVPNGLWEALQHADAARLRAEVAKDPQGASLLQDRHYEAYESRRLALVARIQEMRDRYGDAAVLALPWPSDGGSTVTMIPGSEPVAH